MTSPDARDKFEDRLKLLEEQFVIREDRRVKSREAAEARGETKANELLGEGALGRVSESSDPALDQLIAQRQDLAASAGNLTADDRQRAAAEVDGIDQRFNALIADRQNDSEASIAARDAGKLGIQQALRTQQRNLKGAVNMGNVGPSGLPAGLLNDAAGSATLARGNLERDIILDNRRATEELQVAKSNAKLNALSGLRDSTAQGLTLRSGAIGAAESSISARRDDLLSRQLQNLNSRDRETFGRLSIINNAISQDIADSTGIRQGVLSEVGQAESQVNAEAQLEIQRIEAEKDPPSGKVLCTVLYRNGELSREVYQGDLEYSVKYVDDDLRLGYYVWGVPLANYIARNDTARAIIRPIVSAWATQMAYTVDKHSTGSWLGWALQGLTPACRLLGACVRLLGYKDQIMQSAWSFEEVL